VGRVSLPVGRQELIIVLMVRIKRSLTKRMEKRTRRTKRWMKMKRMRMSRWMRNLKRMIRMICLHSKWTSMMKSLLVLVSPFFLSELMIAMGAFANVKGLSFYRDNNEDPYITLKEVSNRTRTR
jgi:hypothetical protein